jgi:hypothetical protein
MGKHVVASLVPNKGSTRIQAFPWHQGEEPEPQGALQDAPLDSLQPAQYARFVVSVPKELGTDPLDAELSLFETDAGEKKKTGQDDKEGKAPIGTWRGRIAKGSDGWSFQVEKAEVPDLAAHLKDGTPSFRWTADGKRYFQVPLHAARVGSAAAEKGKEADPTWEIVFELKAGAKGKALEKVPISPAPLKAVLTSGLSHVTVLLDLPFDEDDSFILESSSGTAVKKTHADGIDVDGKHLSIAFDNVRPKATWTLKQVHGKGKATTAIFHKMPAEGLVFVKETPPKALPNLYFTLKDPIEKPKDPDLAGTAPDFSAIVVKEPKTQ